MFASFTSFVEVGCLHSLQGDVAVSLLQAAKELPFAGRQVGRPRKKFFLLQLFSVVNPRPY